MIDGVEWKSSPIWKPDTIRSSNSWKTSTKELSGRCRAASRIRSEENPGKMGNCQARENNLFGLLVAR